MICAIASAALAFADAAASAVFSLAVATASAAFPPRVAIASTRAIAAFGPCAPRRHRAARPCARSRVAIRSRRPARPAAAHPDEITAAAASETQPIAPGSDLDREAEGSDRRTLDVRVGEGRRSLGVVVESTCPWTVPTATRPPRRSRPAAARRSAPFAGAASARPAATASPPTSGRDPGAARGDQARRAAPALRSREAPRKPRRARPTSGRSPPRTSTAGRRGSRSRRPPGGELSAARIGELCLEGLRKLDRGAYLQFAGNSPGVSEPGNPRK